MTTPISTADRLLDAQVAWVIEELSGERLLRVIAGGVDELLVVAAEVRLVDVASADAVIEVIELLLRAVPASPVVAAAVQATADQVHAGPPESVSPADLVGRDRVAALVDAGLVLTPLIDQTLDRLTESPLVGTLASRFITRLVVDVLEANRSLTKKIPGVGSLVSFGTSAATKMVGVADKQVQALLGGEMAGKGTAMAVRRLNSVFMSTLQDPMFRDAVLEVWDTLSAEPVEGLGDMIEQDDLRRVVLALHDIIVAGAPSAPVRVFIATWVRAAFDRHVDDTIATLIDGLGLSRDDLLAIATAIVPPLVNAAIADGQLEQTVRTRLEPFYRSPAVTVILSDVR